jgi:uncharacterized protein YciI
MHLFFKLLPPRPTFAADMTEQERALMAQHAIYIRTHYDAGAVLAYGPVLSTEGAFGMAILDMPDLATAETFAANDPTVIAKLNTYQICPMHLAGSQPSRIL